MRTMLEEEIPEAKMIESMRRSERSALDVGVRRNQLPGRISESTIRTIDSKMEEADALYADGSRPLTQNWDAGDYEIKGASFGIVCHGNEVVCHNNEVIYN